MTKNREVDVGKADPLDKREVDGVVPLLNVEYVLSIGAVAGGCWVDVDTFLLGEEIAGEEMEELPPLGLLPRVDDPRELRATRVGIGLRFRCCRRATIQGSGRDEKVRAVGRTGGRKERTSERRVRL